MTNLEELQEALDNRPKMEKRIPTLTDFLRYYGKLDEWAEDFTRKFATYRKQVSEVLKRFEEHAGDYDSETGFFQREDWERLKKAVGVEK